MVEDVPRIVALNAAERIDSVMEKGVVNYAVKIERIVNAIEAELTSEGNHNLHRQP